MKNKQEDHPEKFWNKLKHLLLINMLYLFLRLEHFYSDQMVNSQNNFWLILSPQDLPSVMKTKQFNMIEFGVVISDAVLIAPLTFLLSIRLNTEAYIKWLWSG